MAGLRILTPRQNMGGTRKAHGPFLQRPDTRRRDLC